MSKKSINEAQFLALLERVLPKTVTDTSVASQVYQAVAHEIRLITSLAAFEAFCAKGSLPDAEESTLTMLREQLEGNFGKGAVELSAADDAQFVWVEIALPTERWQGRIPVVPPGEYEDVAAPWVAFPVVLSDDPELVWTLARRENLAPGEAGRALFDLAEEFWASKKGQALQRKGVARCWSEFIAHVPAGALREHGLRRHYPDPETIYRLKTGHVANDAE